MKTAKILVVEDDEGWRNTLKDLLESEGYIVQSVANSQEASNALKLPGIQLVIMDLRLDDVDESNIEMDKSKPEGLELLAYIGMYNPCARAIVVTALSAHKYEREAYQKLGVFDYFYKTKFEPNQFIQSSRDAIDAAFECEVGRKERPIYPDLI